MTKFGIEIIDPSGKAPIRAFIGEDDFLWHWINITTPDVVAGEILLSTPQGYQIKDGAIVPTTGSGEVHSVALDVSTMGVVKANMVAKGLKEVSREEFRKQSVLDSRIVAVIPI